MTSQQWPTLQNRVQGSQNKNQLTPAQQQQMTQAQLTYAQKVKGGGGNAISQNINQQQAQNPQFRMVPTQPNILQQQASNINIPASALQNYAYPYNYTNLQQQQQQQQQQLQQQQGLRNAYQQQQQSNRNNYNQMQTQTQTQTQNQNQNQYQQNSYQQQQQQPQPQQSRPQQRGYGQPRDFYDRRVQNNVTSAVSQYYNQNSSQNSNQNNNNTNNRFGGFNSNNNRRVRNSNFGQKPSYGGAGRGGGRGGGGGGRGGRGGSSSSGRRTSFKNEPSLNKMKENRAKRGKPSESQLKTYETAADRDVLCWIYENQGKCRYGEKCQWLHLDRETGKYVPTVYIMNSLDKTTPYKPSHTTSDKDEDTSDPSDPSDNTATATKTKDSSQNEEDTKDAEDGRGTQEAQELMNKFQLLMEKKIRKNLEKKNINQQIDVHEEDNKEEKRVNNTNIKMKNVEQNANADININANANTNMNTNTNKNTNTNTTKNPDKMEESAKGGYGSYGTTFDRQNVCWEFNTFVGCRKGSKCKWSHQYLVKDATHPYTGEKLNGMAVRKFRLSNNI